MVVFRGLGYTEGTQYAADLGHTRVVSAAVNTAAHMLGPDAHGTKFVNVKSPGIKTQALLPKDHRAPRIQTYSNGRNQKKRRQNDHGKKRKNNIEHSF